MAAVTANTNYDTEGVVLAGTAKTDIVTVPSNVGLWYDVTSVLVTLGTGSAGTLAIVYWYDASAAVEYVLNDGAAVAVGIPAEWEGMPLHMESGDIIRVKAAANYHVIVSFIRGSRNPENR